MKKDKYKIIRYKSGRFGVRIWYSMFSYYDSHHRFKTEEEAREFIDAYKFYDLDQQVEEVYT